MTDQNSVAWDDLSPFVHGYIEALFWTECATGTTMADWFEEENQSDLEEGAIDGCLPGDSSFDELHPDALNSIHTDCSNFERAASKWLSMAYARGYSRERAGHDFWLTRNGHGAGFWDRDELKADNIGDELTALCKPFGDSNPWFGDHVEYGNAPFVYVE